MPVEQSGIEIGCHGQPCAMHTVRRGSPEVQVHSSAPLVEHSTITIRLAELGVIIKQAQWHLHETLELIERLRVHYLHIEDKLSDAEREQATLMTEASRLFDASELSQCLAVASVGFTSGRGDPASRWVNHHGNRHSDRAS